jgi:hypothetical protein
MGPNCRKPIPGYPTPQRLKESLAGKHEGQLQKYKGVRSRFPPVSPVGAGTKPHLYRRAFALGSSHYPTILSLSVLI